MYIHIEKEIIKKLERENLIKFISLWDTTQNAFNFYNEEKEIYTGYNDEDAIMALATPIKVFVFRDNRGKVNDEHRKLYLLLNKGYCKALKIL